MKTLQLAALVALVGTSLTGCSKKEEPAAATEAAPAPEAGAAAVAPETAAPTPVVDNAAAQAAIAEADAALKAQEWEKATDALLKMQLSGAIQSDAQSWDYNRRMTVLQTDLAAAAANGDAKAQAAIDLLRRSRRVP